MRLSRQLFQERTSQSVVVEAEEDRVGIRLRHDEGGGTMTASHVSNPGTGMQFFFHFIRSPGTSLRPGSVRTTQLGRQNV